MKWWSCTFFSYHSQMDSVFCWWRRECWTTEVHIARRPWPTFVGLISTSVQALFSWQQSRGNKVWQCVANCWKNLTQIGLNVTGHECWISYLTTNNKRLNMVWLAEDEPRPEVLKTGFRSRRRMFTIFFNSQGPVVVDIMPGKQRRRQASEFGGHLRVKLIFWRGKIEFLKRYCYLPMPFVSLTEFYIFLRDNY